MEFISSSVRISSSPYDCSFKNARKFSSGKFSSLIKMSEDSSVGISEVTGRTGKLKYDSGQ